MTLRVVPEGLAAAAAAVEALTARLAAAHAALLPCVDWYLCGEEEGAALWGGGSRVVDANDAKISRPRSDAEAAANAAVPIINSRRRPIRSPRVPIVIRKPAIRKP